MRQFRALLRVQLRGCWRPRAEPVAARRVPARRWSSWPSWRRCPPARRVVYAAALKASLPPPLADLTLVIMAVLGVVVAAMFGSNSVASFVFQGRDNDLLLSLPIPPLTLVLARLVAVLVENLIPLLFLVLPAGAVYAMDEPVGVAFWPGMIVGVVLLAFLASAVGLAIGFVIAMVQARVRRRALVQNILYAVSFLAILWVALTAQTQLSLMATADPQSLRAALRAWAAPAYWLRDAALDADLGALALLALVGNVPFLALSAGLSRLLGVVTTALATHAGRVRGFRLGAMPSSSPRRALVRKELRRLFGTPIYLMNTCVGLLILLALTAYVAVAGVPAELEVAADALGLPIAALLLAALLGILALSATTAPSISLEGNRFWILREAPLAAGDILAGKLAANLVVALPVAFVATVTVGVRSGLPAMDVAVSLLVAAVFMALVAEVGLVANLWFPKLDAPSDVVAVKQSVSVLVAMGGGALAAVLVIVALVTLTPRLGLALAGVLIAAALAVGDYALWAVLCGRYGTRLLEAL